MKRIVFATLAILLLTCSNSDKAPTQSSSNIYVTEKFFVGDFDIGKNKCWECQQVQADVYCIELGFDGADAYWCGVPCPATGSGYAIRHIRCWKNN